MALFPVEATGLTKRYGNSIVVDNVSIAVSEGELFGLLGPNGSGKTTIIRMLTGQIPSTNGKINVMGVDVTKSPVEARALVGIVPEQESPPTFLTPLEFFRLIGSIRKLNDIDHRAGYWLDLLGFHDQKDVLCKDLSRGTRQKLMFAQAFLHEPKMAFIDEPLVNLDPIIQRKIKDFLKSYVNKGNSVFLTTHDLDIAQELCTRISILSKGRIIKHIDRVNHSRHDLEKVFMESVKNA